MAENGNQEEQAQPASVPNPRAGVPGGTAFLNRAARFRAGHLNRNPRNPNYGQAGNQQQAEQNS